MTPVAGWEPTLMTLPDGTLAFSDSEEWRMICEARSIMKMEDPERWLWSLERIRGPEAVAALRQTIREIEAAG